jgi:hypothetical protein
MYNARRLSCTFSLPVRFNTRVTTGIREICHYQDPGLELAKLLELSLVDIHGDMAL